MSGALSDSLRRYLTSRYPGAVMSDLQFIKSGWESDVYGLALRLPDHPPKSFVLRFYPGEGGVAKLMREAGGMRQLDGAGYPVPAMLLHEADSAVLGRPFSIMERLEGRALWPVLAEAFPHQARHLLERFGTLLAWLHRLDWRQFTERAALYEANPTAILSELLASMEGLYKRFGLDGFLPVVEWLETHKPDIAVQPAVVHLDFHANNVFLCDDDRLAVIDWTQLTVSDYRADLSWTLMIMGDLGQRRWGEDILQAYALAAGKPVEHLGYFSVISYSKLLASSVISLKTSPIELGIRPETVESTRRQAPILRELSHRIQHITGVAVPEVETALSEIS